MKKLSVLLSITLLVLVAPLAARADWSMPMGDDGYYYNSKGKYVHTNMQKIEIFIPTVSQNQGVIFANPGATDLSSSSWSSNRVNPNYVLLTGNSVSSLTWTSLFTGTVPSTFYLDYLVYGTNRNKPVFGVRLLLENGGLSSWSQLDINNLPSYDRNVVPLPPSAWLLGVGLIGMLIAKRKFGKLNLA